MVPAMKHLPGKAAVGFAFALAPLSLAIAMASCSSSSGAAFGSGTDSGGGGSDSGGKDGSSATDGGSGTDSSPSEGGGATNGIGMTCTPDADAGQGSCDTGFICLALQGGTNAWCSKTCVQATDHCADGYTGIGKPQCTLSVDSVDYCGVICQDETDGGICSPTTCNGTCPGSLACTGQLQNTSAQNVAKLCQ